MKTKLTLAFAALMTSTAFAAFQAPLPEFKNEKQLAEWRAEKSSEATSQSYAVEETAFYTGKPYLALAGGYVFKYRSYNPTLARWTSDDPSGFPDGSNNTLYVGNSSSYFFDPDGLQRYSVEYYGLGVSETQTFANINTYISANNITGTAPGPLNQAVDSLYQMFKNSINREYAVGKAETPGQRYDYELDNGTGSLLMDWKRINAVSFTKTDDKNCNYTFNAQVTSVRNYIYE